MYVAGVLSPQQVQHVPRSTRSTWKKQDLTSLVGTELAQLLEEQLDLVRDMNRYKKLEQITLAVHTVYLTLTAVLDSARSKKAMFRKNKEIILKAIDQIKTQVGFQKALDYFQISAQQYYGWKRKLDCPASPVSLCRRKHPLQLAFKEVQTIKKYLLDHRYRYWKMPSIQALMAREGAAYISLTTLYSYAHHLKLSRIAIKNRRKKYKEGIRAKRPLELLHMDVTIYRPLDGSKVYIYFIQDNFSRAILGWKASLELSAKTACKNLLEVYDKFIRGSGRHAELLTDGGPENQGEVKRFTLDPKTVIQQITALREDVPSNSMVEALNQRIKYDFLFCRELPDFTHTTKFLEEAVQEYNEVKPHGVLQYLTPWEVLEGEIPIADRYKQEFALAKVKRIQENKSFDCSGY